MLGDWGLEVFVEEMGNYGLGFYSAEGLQQKAV